MKKLYLFIYIMVIMVFLPVSTFGSDISTNDFRLVLPGNWKSKIEEDGVSAKIEKDVSGFYKTFALSLSNKVSDSEFKKSKADFSQHFNSIESKDKSLRLVTGDLINQNKNGIEYNYFVLFGMNDNTLSFYALTSIKNRVALISYKVFQVTDDLGSWEKEFVTVLNSLK